MLAEMSQVTITCIFDLLPPGCTLLQAMKILLISTNRNACPMPVMPVGACIVANASRRAGHTVQLVDLMFSRDAISEVRSAVETFKPDVAGLSIRNIDNVYMSNPVFYLDELKSIVDTIRAGTGAPIVLGGAALGVMPEQILRLFPDCIAVAGDGEVVFVQLLELISRNESFRELPGIAFIENSEFRLNRDSAAVFSATCQAPDYHRWIDTQAYRSRLATVPIQTKIGCQFQCVYCSYPTIEGNRCCYKDTDSVAEAVRRLAAGGLRDVEIVDSIFNAPQEHAMKVCDSIAKVEHKARIQCLELNPLDFDDSLLAAMERAGFSGMGITVESASDQVLQGLKKGFTSCQVHHAAEVVKRHRIPCAWILLFGGPGETRETVLETLRFAERAVRSEDVVFFNAGIRIYPGTELEIIARKQGVLSCSSEEMLAPVFYVSPDLDADWMEQKLRRAMADNMNFINVASLGFSFLPAINSFASKFGLRPPLWRYTRIIRKLLRSAGMDV